MIQNNVSFFYDQYSLIEFLEGFNQFFDIIFFIILFIAKAVVNEDSTGDVIALQHQIRLLKVVLFYV